MLQIRCPHCGPRPENEFAFGGQSHIPRPALQCTDQEWGQYLHFRDNPRGAHAECWRHTFGCAEWFNVVRDTVNHEVLAVYTMGAPRPEVIQA